MVDLRAWDRARAIGAVEEAETLGCAVVGTGHFLLATLAEPSVRWAFRTVGVDRPDVQAEVVRIDGGRSRLRRAVMTREARDAIMRIGSTSDALDVDEPARDEVARVLRVLARGFLSRSRSSEARDILDGLGALTLRTRVLATIEHNARPGRALPAGTGSSSHRRTSLDHLRVIGPTDGRVGPGPLGG